MKKYVVLIMLCSIALAVHVERFTSYEGTNYEQPYITPADIEPNSPMWFDFTTDDMNQPRYLRFIYDANFFDISDANYFTAAEPNVFIDWTNTNRHFKTTGNAEVQNLLVNTDANVIGDLYVGGTAYFGGFTFSEMETDPCFVAHPAYGLTAQDMTDIGNLSGTNTGDQVIPNNEAGAANNFLTAYNSATGAWTKARPTWANIDKTTSSIADITTKSHTSLTDIGTNTHAQIDTFIGTTVSATYVPYTGATDDVDLGNYDILATGGTVSRITAQTGTFGAQVLEDSTFDVDNDGYSDNPPESPWTLGEGGGHFSITGGKLVRANEGGSTDTCTQDVKCIAGQTYRLQGTVTLVDHGGSWGYDLNFVLGGDTVATWAHTDGTTAFDEIVTAGATGTNFALEGTGTFTNFTIASILLTPADGIDVGTMTIESGSVTDSSGAISFGDENLSGTGEMVLGANLNGSLLKVYGDADGEFLTWDPSDGATLSIHGGLYVTGSTIIPKLSNLTTNGLVTTSGGIGTLSITDPTNWNTAYGWGNHASGGYLKADGTVDLAGDLVPDGPNTRDLGNATDYFAQVYCREFYASYLYDKAGTNSGMYFSGTNVEFVSSGNSMFRVMTPTTKQLLGCEFNFDADTKGDLKFRGAADENLFYIDQSTDMVGIGDATPSYKLDVNGEINAVSGFRVNGAAGASGSFTSADGKTITVTNGLITAITGP